MSKKSVLFLTLVLTLTLLLTGCFNIKADMVIDENGAGYIEAEVKMPLIEGLTDTINEGSTAVIEEVEGIKYLVDRKKMEFKSLEELRAVSVGDDTIEGFLKDLKVEGDLVSLYLATPDITDEDTEEIDLPQGMDTSAINQLMTVTYKITIKVPGKILDTSGKIEGNTVTWDLNLTNAGSTLNGKPYEDSDLYVTYQNPKKLTQSERIVQVLLDGVAIVFDQEPIIENSRTLVPIRAISEALGYDVDWNQDERLATIKSPSGDTTLLLSTKNDYLTYTHKDETTRIPLDVGMRVENGRILVPLRVISETLGVEVEWNQADYTAILTRR